jgi:hypothetical protein
LLISRDVEQMKGSSGLSAAADVGKNPIAAMKEFTGSIENFAAVVGGPLMGPAAKALDSLAHSIEDFTSRVQKVKGFWPSADEQKTYHAFSGPSPDAAIRDWDAQRLGAPGAAGPGGWSLLPQSDRPPARPMEVPQSWTPAGTIAAGEPMQLPGAQPASPVGTKLEPYHQVTVAGQAELQQSLNVTITLDPEIRAMIASSRQSASVTIPLAGGGTGRMDSDAGPTRSGGVGSM